MDLTRLPVGGMVVGFLILALGVTFAGAFMATDGGGEEAEDGGGQETPAPDGGGDGGITVSMGDNFFGPDEFTVTAGSSVTFDITNEGAVTHNMHIAGPDGEYTEQVCDGEADPCSDPPIVGPGQTATLTWTVPDSPGEVPFQCDFHPTQMTGTITVQ